MTANDDSIIVDRTVDARPRPLLVAVGSQGWADLRRDRARRARRWALRAVVVGFAVGFVIGALSVVPW